MNTAYSIDSDPTRLMTFVRAADARLLGVASGLSAAAGRAATDLPGWSRAHVVAHLSTLAAAFLRQTRAAMAGELVEMYDGGRPGRDRGIEEGAREPWDELVAGLSSHVTELEKMWSKLETGLWDSPVAYRNATLLAALQCWWREVEIHGVDLKTGYGPADWAPELSAHLIQFFSPRLPSDQKIIVRADETGQRWEFGMGSPLEVAGALPELAGWLAQRSAGEKLRTTPAAALPEVSSTWP
jgi:maleylpyruvate isomerase